jgi:hypothetical protein
MKSTSQIVVSRIAQSLGAPAALPDDSEIVHCCFASAKAILKQVQNDGLRPDVVIIRIKSVPAIFLRPYSFQ